MAGFDADLGLFIAIH